MLGKWSASELNLFYWGKYIFFINSDIVIPKSKQTLRRISQIKGFSVMNIVRMKHNQIVIFSVGKWGTKLNKNLDEKNKLENKGL